MGRLGVATAADTLVYSLSDDFKALNAVQRQAYVDRAENAIARRGPFLTSKEGYAEDMLVAVVKVAERLFYKDQEDRVRLSSQGVTRFSAGSYSQTNDGKADPLDDREVLDTINAYADPMATPALAISRDRTLDEDGPKVGPWGGVGSSV